MTLLLQPSHFFASAERLSLLTLLYLAVNSVPISFTIFLRVWKNSRYGFPPGAAIVQRSEGVALLALARRPVRCHTVRPKEEA